MAGNNGATVNFFTPGRFSFKTPKGQQAQLTQQTDYPDTGTIKLALSLPNAEDMALQIRIPAWSTQTTVLVNGQPVDNVVAGQYATIRRTWQPTDEVTLTLDMRGRLVKMGALSEHVAILRGPLVLARDSRLDKLSIDEPINPLVDKNGFVTLEPVEKKDPAFLGAIQSQICCRIAPGTGRPASFITPLRLCICR